MSRQQHWDEKTVNLMLTLRRQGKSCADIARLIGRTRNAVIGKLNRMDRIKDRRITGSVKAQQTRHFTDDDDLKLLTMRENLGLSFGEIGKAMDTSSIIIERRYKELSAEFELEDCA